MINKLSHSAATKFQTCPKEYEFHYIKKLRPKYQSSALLFGTGVDKAFEALMQDKDPHQAFDKNWAFQEVNKKLQSLPECTSIVYSDSEFDEDLLTEAHREKIALWLGVNEPNNILSPMEVYDTIKLEKKKFGYKQLPAHKQRFYNLVNWCCLERKGHLMIEAMKKKVLPKLSKILATQKRIELTNDEGDTILGFTDLVAEYQGNIVVFDLKTSTINYEEDSVLTSAQLSLYVHALYEEFQTRKAGFIVLNKRIVKNKTKQCLICSHDGTGSKARSCDNQIDGKRCGAEWHEKIKPEVFVQIIVDDIPAQTENIVIENMDYINQSIKKGIFVRNLSSCVRPWGKCTFFDVCYKQDYSQILNMSEPLEEDK